LRTWQNNLQASGWEEQKFGTDIFAGGFMEAEMSTKQQTSIEAAKC
jgi:hypothetical protein